MDGNNIVPRRYIAKDGVISGAFIPRHSIETDGA